MKTRILAVGIATLDIINRVDGYPPENAEVRALGQRVARGGNATNTLSVLAQLGHACRWAGVWVDEADGRRILGELQADGIETGDCRVLAQGKMPVSYICLNARNGSRSIVHHRDLPEFSAEDFARIDLDGLDWLHFEGRNPAETLEMMRRARRLRPGLPVSLEVEKPRPGLEALFPHCDLLLGSRVYAHSQGVTAAPAWLRALRTQTPQARLVCAWGEGGAYGLERDGRACFSPAFPPPRLVDTLGAGDTFNAGVIHALLQGGDLAEALDFACRLAGRKCGQEGLRGLAAV